MAIIAGDIKIYESEKMTDETDAGGKITGTEVSCGTINNIFPNISRLDRLGGRTQFRKVFPKIISQNQDVYSGAHIALQEAPTDENVSITLFDTGTKDDLNSDMLTNFEDYFNASISAGTATLAFETLAGANSLTFEISTWDYWRVTITGIAGSEYFTWSGSTTVKTLNVATGDVIQVDSEYLQVQKIEELTQIVTDTATKRTGSSYKTIYLTHPSQSPHSVGATVNTTIVNGEWKCYGATQLSEAVSPGEIELPVISEKVRVMPTINLPTDTEGIYPISKPLLADGVTVGVAPDTWTIDGVEQPFMTEYIVANAGQTVYACIVSQTPILDGSLRLMIRYQNEWKSVTDDGAGALQGWGTGSVDVDTGVINVNFVGAADENTHIIISYRLEIGYKENTNVPIGDPGSLPVTLDFSQTGLKDGSIRISFDDSDARTVKIYDDGAGILKYDRGVTIETPNDSSEAPRNRDEGRLTQGMHSFNNVFFAVNNYIPARNEIWKSATGSGFTVEYAFNTSTQIDFSNCKYRSSGCVTYDEQNNIMILFGKEASSIPNQCIGYRIGVTGAFTWVEDPISSWIKTGVAFKGYFIYAGSTTRDGINTHIRVVDTSTFSSFTTIPNSASGCNWSWAAGVDGDGSDLIIGMTDHYRIQRITGPDFSDSNNWEPLTSFVAQNYISSIVCDTSTKTWMAVSYDSDVLVSTDGFQTYTDKSSILRGHASWGATWDIYQVSVIGGTFFVTSFYTGTVLYSTDAGDSWSALSITVPPTYGTVVSGYTICGNDQYIVGTGSCSSTSYKSYRWAYVGMSDLPEVAGTINTETGTGTISAGEDPNSTVMATYFLQDLEITDFAVPVEVGLPITDNTFSISARKLSDYSVVTISEVGGSLTGDGSGTLNKVHGYALLSFNDPVIPDSLVIATEGSMIFQPQYDEFDTDRLPTSGLVPGFQVGDTIIIQDGVNIDMALVTSVTKNLITIAVEDGLSNSYSAGTLVSNAVVVGDLVSSEGTYFSESVWPGGWYDEMQGVPADGTYDSINYPAVVTNNGAVTERWKCTVTGVTPTLMQVEGEAVGIVLTDAPISGSISPANPNATDPYFTLPPAAWSAEGTHQIGNVYRWNTIGTEVPLWICRTINARSSDTATDDFILEIRGDIE